MVRSPSFQSFPFHYAENERAAIALTWIDIAPCIAAKPQIKKKTSGQTATHSARASKYIKFSKLSNFDHDSETGNVRLARSLASR
jgi:hypothetical protein